MLAAAPLFILHERPGGEAVLPWSEARKIDWGIIMLFGGGISLGTQMFDTGLASALGRGFVELAGVHDVWMLTLVAIGDGVGSSYVVTAVAVPAADDRGLDDARPPEGRRLPAR